MSNITELLDAFDEAARDWGWQGDRCIEESRVAHLKTRQALLDAIRGLERDAERLDWLSNHALGMDAVADPDGFTVVFYGTDPCKQSHGRTLRRAIDAASILYPGVDIDAVHRSKE